MSPAPCGSAQGTALHPRGYGHPPARRLLRACAAPQPSRGSPRGAASGVTLTALVPLHPLCPSPDPCPWRVCRTEVGGGGSDLAVGRSGRFWGKAGQWHGAWFGLPSSGITESSSPKPYNCLMGTWSALCSLVGLHQGGVSLRGAPRCGNKRGGQRGRGGAGQDTRRGFGERIPGGCTSWAWHEAKMASCRCASRDYATTWARPTRSRVWTVLKVQCLVDEI